jgi:uncharacterized coiled-coil protein SlyX
MPDPQPVADSTASYSSAPLPTALPTGSGATMPGNASFFQNKAMQPYLVGGVIVVLVLFLAYQQVQINHLTSELSSVTDSVKSSDVKTRLESQEHSLDELNTRLAYLDSKINATDQKAQDALRRIKAHEDNDVIGNMIKTLKQSLGIQ